MTAPPGRADIESAQWNRRSLPGDPPAVSSWLTRANLLRDRAAALRALHHADLSLRTFALTAAITIAAGVFFLLIGAIFVESDTGLAAEDSTNPVGIALISLIASPALPLAWWAWRRTKRASLIGRIRRTWEDLSESVEARQLPRGDVDPATREPFDARDDEDADRYIGVLLANLQGAPFETRLLLRGFLVGMGFPAGVIMTIIPFHARDPVAVGFLMLGPLLTFASALQIRKTCARAWRDTQRWKRARKEYDAWRAGDPAAYTPEYRTLHQP